MKSRFTLLVVAVLFHIILTSQAQVVDAGMKANFEKLSKGFEEKGLAEQYKGISENGTHRNGSV